jgi:hypothetical protein
MGNVVNELDDFFVEMHLVKLVKLLNQIDENKKYGFKVTKKEYSIEPISDNARIIIKKKSGDIFLGFDNKLEPTKYNFYKDDIYSIIKKENKNIFGDDLNNVRYSFWAKECIEYYQDEFDKEQKNLRKRNIYKNNNLKK